MTSSKHCNFAHHPPGKGQHAIHFPACDMSSSLILLMMTEKEGLDEEIKEISVNTHLPLKGPAN